MDVCPNCNKERAPKDYLFPLGSLRGVKYCKCIGWRSLYSCGVLAASNARRLLDDGDFLLKSAGPELYDWFKKVEPDMAMPSDEESKSLALRVNYPRLTTALSLLILSMQELGKAILADEYIRKQKDLHYDRDYWGRFHSHDDRLITAVDLMKRIHRWPPELEKRSKDLEVLRLGSLYVDYNFALGIWLDPTSLGSPEESGSIYSDLVLTGLLEGISGSKDQRNGEDLDLILGLERFTTFGFCYGLAVFLSPTINDLLTYFISLLKKPQVKEELAKSVRFAEFLGEAEDFPEPLREKEMLRRLEMITELLSPGFAAQFNKEFREHYSLDG
jgi:AbiV family abortive infection protein